MNRVTHSWGRLHEMTDLPFVCSAWGGCGNLAVNLLYSDRYYQNITDYYNSINVTRSWTDQEWSISPRVNINGLTHQYKHNSGQLYVGWRSSLDTTFHYLIKNPQVSHLTGSTLEKYRGVLRQNQLLENRFRRTEYWQVDSLLAHTDRTIELVREINPDVKINQLRTILALWRERTQEYYEKNHKQVLKTLHKIVPNYSTENFNRLLDS